MVRVEGGPGDSASAGCLGAADGRHEGGPRHWPGEVGGRVGDVDQIGAGLGGSCDRDDVVPAPAAGTDASAQGAVGVQSRAQPGGAQIVDQRAGVVVLGSTDGWTQTWTGASHSGSRPE